MDVITDFNRREGDHIDVRAIDANPIVPRNQDFTYIGTDEFSARGQIRYFTDGTDTFIALNTDAEFFDNDAVIRVVGVHTVDAFWVIRRPHRRKKNQCVMNRQQSTSTSGKTPPREPQGGGEHTECAATAVAQLAGTRAVQPNDATPPPAACSDAPVRAALPRAAVSAQAARPPLRKMHRRHARS